MSTHSTDGREWAKLSALKAGDKLKVDGGFTCLADGDVRLVLLDTNGEKYIRCGSGKHTLDGQVSEEDHDHLVGMWPA